MSDFPIHILNNYTLWTVPELSSTGFSINDQNSNADVKPTREINLYRNFVITKPGK